MEGRGDSCRVLSLLACSCQAPNQNPSQHPCRACKLLEASSGGGGGAWLLVNGSWRDTCKAKYMDWNQTVGGEDCFIFN